MKKAILFLAFLNLMFVLKSSAQNWRYDIITNTGSTPTTYLINNSSSADILFGTSSTQQMDLQNTTGYLGIGNSFSPSHLLDISGGDMNINTTNRGYMVGGNYVLWHNGITSNIFVGVNAGNAAGTGQANTFVGYNAGNTFGAAANNTAIGENALLLNQAGAANTAVGNGSLQNNLVSYNTAVGAGALFANNLLSGNTAVGDSALFNLAGVTAFNSGNVAVGNSTLYANNGNFNTAIGEWAMRYNSAANSCVATGYAALYSNTISCQYRRWL